MMTTSFNKGGEVGMIVITTMDALPDYCYDCPCHNGEYGICEADKGKRSTYERPYWCPLAEVPTIPPVECVDYYDELQKEVAEKCGNCGGIMYGEPCYCPFCGTEVKR